MKQMEHTIIPDEFLNSNRSPYSIAAALVKVYCLKMGIVVKDAVIKSTFNKSSMTLLRAKKEILNNTNVILDELKHTLVR